MDNYDVVIEKTVRDLFKSSKLAQIKKYKTSKDSEIIKREEDLQNLILDKYPILIQSISALEKISENLSDLQEIRKLLGENVNRLEKECDLREYQTGFILGHKKIQNLIEIPENFVDQEEIVKNELEQCENYILFKNINEALFQLIETKKKISNIANNELLVKHFDYILVDLFETCVEIYLSGKEHLKLKNSFYFIFGCFYLIFNRSYLNFSQTKVKLDKEENVNYIYSRIFGEELSQIDQESKLYFTFFKTFEILIKLQILKISNHLQKENKIHEIFTDCYITTLLLSNLYFEYDHVYYTDEEKELFSKIDKSHKYKNKLHDFDSKQILSEISVLFCIDSKSINTLVQLKDNQKILNQSRNFLTIINHEIKKSFSKFENTNSSIVNWFEANRKIEIAFKNENKTVINNFRNLFDLNHNESDDLSACFNNIFLDTCVNHFKLFLKTQLCEMNKQFLSQIIADFNSIKNSKQKNNLFYFSLLETLKKEILEYFYTAKNKIKDHNLLNSLIKTYSNKTVKSFFLENEFSEGLTELKIFKEAYYQKDMCLISNYVNSVGKFLLIENYIEESYYSNEELFSNTFYRLSDYLSHNHLYEEIDMDDGDEINFKNVKQHILEIIAEKYLDIMGCILNNHKTLNRRLLSDIRLIVLLSDEIGLVTVNKKLLEIFEKLQKEFCSNESLDLSIEVKNSKFYSFFKTGLEKNNYLENRLDIIQSKFPRSIKQNTQIPLQLSQFVIRSKTCKDKEQTAHPNMKKANAAASTKLLLHSIDSSYISVKPSPLPQPHQPTPQKGSHQNQSNNPTKKPDESNIKNYLGYFGGMLKDLYQTGIATDPSQHNSK